MKKIITSCIMIGCAFISCLSAPPPSNVKLGRCSECNGKGKIQIKEECDLCKGHGYLSNDYPRYGAICGKCSKNGAKASTKSFPSSYNNKTYSRQVGPGYILMMKNCSHCNGRGYINQVQNNKYNQSSDNDEQVIINIKRSSIRTLLSEGFLESKKYRFVLVDDEI